MPRSFFGDDQPDWVMNLFPKMGKLILKMPFDGKAFYERFHDGSLRRMLTVACRLSPADWHTIVTNGLECSHLIVTPSGGRKDFETKKQVVSENTTKIVVERTKLIIFEPQEVNVSRCDRMKVAGIFLGHPDSRIPCQIQFARSFDQYQTWYNDDEG